MAVSHTRRPVKPEAFAKFARNDDTMLLPQECVKVKDNTITEQKRGWKGGRQERIKRQPYRQPLPSIMLGNVQRKE